MKPFLYTWLAMLVLMAGATAVVAAMVWIMRAIPADTHPLVAFSLYVLLLSAVMAFVMSRPTPRWVGRLVEAHTRLTSDKKETQ